VLPTPDLSEFPANGCAGTAVKQAGRMTPDTCYTLPAGYPSSSRRHARQAARERRQHPSRAYAMLYLQPLEYAEPGLEFCSFDATYVDNLRAGDRATQEHFVTYFTALLQLKLRSRLHSPQAIEDVRQETFARVLKTLRNEGTLRQPERLGAFVNTVCNNVLFEHYRSSSRSESLDEEGKPEPHATGANAFQQVVSKQLTVKVREILLDMPPRDRKLLKAVFLDERDRDEVCAEFGVDREYLRVLLYRAKKDFKAEFLKRVGDHLPLGSQA
jgi:RNA polymerase sigma-70 factor (ECF subfamily)